MPRRARLRVVVRQPGYEGKRDVAPALVESPYVKGEFEVVVLNFGESNLATMFKRNQIDKAQLEAGDWFRKVYEQTRMGSMAIDPSREPVDTSGQADPIPDTLIDASKQLRAARAELGRMGYQIVERVCGEGRTLDEVATQQYGNPTAREMDFIGRLFKTSLDGLAAYLGFATSKNRLTD